MEKISNFRLLKPIVTCLTNSKKLKIEIENIRQSLQWKSNNFCSEAPTPFICDCQNYKQRQKRKKWGHTRLLVHRTKLSWQKKMRWIMFNLATWPVNHFNARIQNYAFSGPMKVLNGALTVVSRFLKAPWTLMVPVK